MDNPSLSSFALLREATLRELIVAGAITGIVAKGGKGGFVVELHLGERIALPSTSQGKSRLFSSIGTIAVLMQKLKHPRFEVDATDYVPGRIRAAQPIDLPR